jgi:hypothetical protein
MKRDKAMDRNLDKLEVQCHLLVGAVEELHRTLEI